MKVLTFVIPAYNSEKFLDKAISSMLVPEIMEKLEVVVVNDGSKDSTAAVAEK
ncbi:MAG: glycosyltransferase, partial [Clostridia bacterium]|nr:glycosyltransferase [Clostridia bacterium]